MNSSPKLYSKLRWAYPWYSCRHPKPWPEALVECVPKKNDILMLGKWDHTHKHEDFTKKINILNYWTMCVLSNCRVGFSNHYYKIRKHNIIDIYIYIILKMNTYVGILNIYIYIIFWQSNILNHEFHPFGRIQTQSPDSQRHLDQLPPPAIAWEELSNRCKLMVEKHVDTSHWW